MGPVMIALRSVGCALNPLSKMTYPLKIDGEPDLSCGVHILDIASDEWWGALSSDDQKKVARTILTD